MAAKKKAAKKRRSSPRATAINRDKKAEREFQAEDDLRTLRRAVEVQGDSVRMGRAKAFALKEMAALRKIKGGK